MIDTSFAFASVKLRVARPTDNLSGLLQFYQTGLGLNLLYRFADHNGFDGVMLGHVGSQYHFEFTRAHGHAAVNQVIDACELTRRFGIRKVWPDAKR